ncbi:deazaflavin-dependent oxidoreductase (nitroreductase family) [Nocardia tenerifensis]|uniref:Deazaflavin-dependent oxidoreductase (Nitroreductase family) n=1 Tax=Nocardia tenerifensis TaxID=228006 RepID=A0A318JT17_9NOCA|nr:nitroreductase family deazaflavin-dependent oxidoreductase [Nocardia tenerifensis]PXX54723.1 deazaflavin-dependent oxidoreductase (nitroreductase family) [Nocardia tenerifensis]
MSAIANLGARALQTRWFVRAPIRLYRAGLGFLFGSRLLMLQHTGRRSGAARFVVLEVVQRPASGEFVVVSGFGSKAQWYRNVLADAKVRVSIGTLRSAPATATPMTEQESAAALEHYVREHPKAWHRLRATIEKATGTPVHNLPMVRLCVDAR